jgi:uncharacterized protein (TIGR03435 family)
MPLRFLLAEAYGVKLGEIYGGPNWMNTDGYDILAKTTPSSGNPNAGDVDIRLRNLLESRFSLRVHHETRQLPVLELTIAKGGTKLQPSNCIPFDPEKRESPTPGTPRPPYCGTLPLQRNGPGWRFTGAGITMTDLIGQLSFGDLRWLDKTGFAGKFNVTLEWIPEPSPRPPDVGAAVQSVESPGPSLSTALQEQLGLSLRSTKAPVEVLVVDYVERPSAN